MSRTRDYLLDTQIGLWIITGNKRLDETKFRDRFVRDESRFIFHQTSTWEIQIKFELGKLPLPKRPQDFLHQTITDSGFQYENISDEGIFFLDKLPPIHRDPFDRLLISHAIVNAWTLISADEILEKYPVRFERV